ncbi:hypothetical protein FB466_0457 [Klugiella xanthotipulae]|uniref:Uncharacterized protein n=1 Tax=Klugiella xanthotipulae TaxID=244735 RepID=A0A543I508_9MICO|nr:hypothetical protein FB466_0457 [Klugiella xanthotipulae]
MFPILLGQVAKRLTVIAKNPFYPDPVAYCEGAENVLDALLFTTDRPARTCR